MITGDVMNNSRQYINKNCEDVNNNMNHYDDLIQQPKQSYNLSCVICLNDFENEQLICILPCNHTYHTTCIIEWIGYDKQKCPICNNLILFLE